MPGISETVARVIISEVLRCQPTCRAPLRFPGTPGAIGRETTTPTVLTLAGVADDDGGVPSSRRHFRRQAWRPADGGARRRDRRGHPWEDRVILQLERALRRPRKAEARGCCGRVRRDGRSSACSRAVAEERVIAAQPREPTDSRYNPIKAGPGAGLEVRREGLWRARLTRIACAVHAMEIAARMREESTEPLGCRREQRETRPSDLPRLPPLPLSSESTKGTGSKRPSSIDLQRTGSCRRRSTQRHPSRSSTARAIAPTNLMGLVSRICGYVEAPAGRQVCDTKRLPAPGRCETHMPFW